jgi:hypothetical protein
MADKRPTINVSFGPLTLSYPHLNTPDDKFGEEVYRGDGTEDPNSAAMKEAKAIFAKAIKTFDLDPETAVLPLVREMVKDPNASPTAKKSKKIATGKLLLKAKTKRAPTLVDANCNPINPKAVEIGGGTRAYLEGFIAPYDFSGKEGISFTLTGVQIVKLVERGGGSNFVKRTDSDGEGYGYNGPPKGDDDDAADLPMRDDDDGDTGASDDGGVLDI